MSHPLAYPSLVGNSLVDVIRLIRSENVGPITFFQVVAYFGSVASALQKIPEMSVRGGRKKPIVLCSKAEAEKEIAATEKSGGTFIIYGDKNYPSLLHAISDPPPVLIVHGHAHLWQQKECVAIVGARNASANGCHFAQKLAESLGKDQFTVVSGLARGIDTFAHKGSLATGTVGVIAGGIDNIYPPENAALFEQMKSQSAVITEHKFGAIPHAHSFPARNRIISGMSRGVVVVEASLRSGSLITARFANDQGREVFAVPGSPMDPRCKGTNDLIRQGATLVQSAEDVIHAIKQIIASPLREKESRPYITFPAQAPSEADLSEARDQVIEKLSPSPVSIDELILQCQLTPALILGVLLELELAGRISRHPGNKVSVRVTE